MSLPRRSAFIGAACVVASALSSAAVAAAVAVPPRPDRYATDRAGVTDAARLAALNERLAQFERETSNQVLVYVDRRVPEGTTLEEFATAAFGAWGVGQKGKDNGVALFVFVDDKKVRFEVGYGLEGPIPDARTAQIRETFLAPRFRAGDYTGGIEQAADQLMKAARGEPFQGTGQTAAESGPTGPLPLWLWIIPVIAMGAGWLAARGATTTESKLARGGGTWGVLTAILMMVSTLFSKDARFLAIGFGVLLLGMALAVAVMVGRGSTLTGRRRLGLWMLQAAAGMLIGGFGLLCLSLVWDTITRFGGYGFLFGFPALVLGALVHSVDPVRILTLFFARTAFIVLLASALFLAAILFVEATGAQTALDWTVVSGVVWIVLWVFARSRGWKLAPKIEISSGSTYSGSGRSGGWSSSGSSSWSSSSSRSSGSSFSGGGGRSGGGGSSGSW